MFNQGNVQSGHLFLSSFHRLHRFSSTPISATARLNFRLGFHRDPKKNRQKGAWF